MRPVDRKVTFLAVTVITVSTWFGATHIDGADDLRKTSAKDLVAQLGAKSYKVREQACLELLSRKKQVEAEIRQGLQSENPEIVARCQTLLLLVRETEREQKLRLFVKTGKLQNGETLPHWNTFQKTFGNKTRTRLLYAIMESAEPDYFANLETKRNQLIGTVNNRCVQLRNQLNSPERSGIPTLGNIANILYLTSLDKNGIDRNTFRSMYSLLLNQTVQANLTGNPQLIRMLDETLKNVPNDTSTLGMATQLAANYQLTGISSDKIRKQLESQFVEITKNASTMSRLQSLCYNAKRLGCQTLIDNKIKPFILQRVKHNVKNGLNYQELQYLVTSANYVQSLPAIRTELRPALISSLSNYSKKPSFNYSDMYRIVSVTRTLGEQELVETYLKPAVRRKLISLKNTTNENSLQLYMNAARYLNMQRDIEVFLKPAIERMVLSHLEKGDSLTNLQQALNLTNRVQITADWAESTFQPILVRIVENNKSNPSINEVYNILNVINTVGLPEKTMTKFKEMTNRSVNQYAKKNIDTRDASRVLSLIERFSMKEALPIAVRMGQQNLPNYYRARAINIVGKFGDKTIINQLQPLLKNTSQVSSFTTNGVKINTQIRDIALATMVHLNGEQLKDYHFAYAKAFKRGYLNTPYSYMGFGSEADRQKAQNMWKNRNAK